ncbi:POK19 protein, partial [Rhabdornis inornatus]|nr:POK19 protein [Rhabdornis inornatus]NXH63092.1 POK19 protein [Rhabdornis inornatus]
VKHITDIPHNPTGQSVVERTHGTIKQVLNQQRGGTETMSPTERLCKALYVINFLNCSFSEPTPPVLWHFSNLARAKLDEKPPVLIKDLETQQISGP